jgi:hypothetical protein
MIELTFREGIKLRRSLRAAFRSQSALKQVIFDQLREDLVQIAGGGDYGEILVKLLVWSEVNSRTVDLIRAVRAGNPGDDSLREFEADYQKQRPNAGDGSGLPPRVLTPVLRLGLVEAVMLIPSSATPDGRSTYLLGLPGSLSRIPNDARADLNMIFDQLDGLGRLATGSWPLLLVIDNILAYVQGYPDISTQISHIKQRLEQAYNAH